MTNKIEPFALIAVPREGDVLADFVERYARAVAERMLPALKLTFEEKHELIRLDMEFREQMRREPWNYNIGSDEYGEYANPEQSFDIGLDNLNYAEMENAALQMHMLGLAFAGLFHIFERQLVMILHRLDYRRRGTVMVLVPKEDRHKFSGYKKILDIGGYPITGDVDSDVERLRLIANIMKHGSAHSLRALKSSFPEMFWHGTTALSVDMILLSTDLLMASATSISRYRREFPHG